ncbi:hypothetical protein ABEY48_20300 [Bacillus mycoides]|uniref:hypothetical protein n=1 Tax=Bacillus mycoides TaxID=1405 RepID=UPI003D1C12F6
MDNQYFEIKINELEKNVSDLQRNKDGLKQALLDVSTNVEALNRKVNMLEETLATKADITHVQLINKQSEIIKKINDSKSVGMDKVGVSLDGRVVAESIVEQTIDSIKISANDIEGVRTNEIK